LKNFHHGNQWPLLWKLQANAIGFASTPPSIQGSSVKKTTTNKNNTNNNDYEEIPEEVLS